MNTEVKSMNKGKFFISLSEAGDFLDKAGILREKNIVNLQKNSENKFSDVFKKLSREESYQPLYQRGIEYNEYDFLLADYSFLQFSMEELSGSVRMAYYPNPNIIESYEKYLEKEWDSTVEEVGDTYREFYEKYNDDEAPQRQVTPLRYDCDVKEYIEVIHSASHLHFGSQGVRVNCRYLLTPLAFVTLIVDLYYYSCWKEILLKETCLSPVVFSVKKQCDLIKKEYFSEKDKEYFYLT